jgi:hypothetical protein
LAAGKAVDKRTRISRYALLLAVLGGAGIVAATGKDVADALHAPTWVVVGIAVTSGLVAIAAAVATTLQAQREEEQASREKREDKERDVVNELLAFLEDRRLLTDDTGYQSHFPDDLRLSAEQIRSHANVGLQRISRDSQLVPILKRIQVAARHFQEATEGAMDGSRAGGGTTPVVPMGLAPYLRSLADYREEIASGMTAAADLYGLRLDEDFSTAFDEGQVVLRQIADADSEGRRTRTSTSDEV